MKTLFAAISSSYVHTLLAPRYLAANSPLPVKIFETNENVDLQKNLDTIVFEKPDVIAFSCYVFNIVYVEKLARALKKSLPRVIIILGGYEAAFDTEKHLSYADYIIRGEGDFAFGELLEKINNGEKGIPKIIEAGTVKELDTVKSPYSNDYLSLGVKSRILYMETSRGCPFGCSYCMSANSHGVRAFSLKRVFSDLEKFRSFNPPLVKFVDRTFNYDTERCAVIFEYIIKRFSDKNTTFHCEMEPELFTEKLFSVLKTAPKGLFQFELGVQSYNGDTLAAVRRRGGAAVDAALRRLVENGNIPVHADLIAGLPKEDFASFARGFDRLFLIFPNCLQLGFLKILRGSEIYGESAGYEVSKTPPYEINSSPVLSENDVSKLKDAEKMLNLYWNSGRFARAVKFLVPAFFSPFSFFASLACYYRDNGLKISALSAPKQCDALYFFAAEKIPAESLAELEKAIYEDFSAAGNVRKWHKWIK